MSILSFVPGVLLVVVLLCGTGFTASVKFSRTDYDAQIVGSAVSADLNRDGLPDIAIAGEAMISVFLATGPGKFGAKVDYPVPTAPDNLRNLLAADFNGDGALDLIVGTGSMSQLFILWNNGDGTFHNGPTLNLSAPAESFDLGDFNHDGLLDIATVECNSGSFISCSINVYLGQGGGEFTKSQSVNLSEPVYQMTVADINGDGNLDLAISRYTQVLLWWGKGDGTFSAPRHLIPPGETDEVQSFAIADLNNDGKLDVVVNTGTNLSSFMGCLSGSSWFYKNTGGNNFSLLWNLNGGCSFLVPIDMNGDLNEDLIFHNGDPDAGWFYGVLGNGNGTLGKSFSYPSFPNQVGGAIYVRDLNLDSRDDYILGDETFGGVAVALQTGGLKNCPPPSSASLAAKICTPASGSHTASPVLVRASGNSPAGVIQLQVWIDGVKQAVKWHGQLAQKFNLSHGTHRVTVVATDKYMGTVKKSVSVTVP